jgi:hypothetical protein
MPKRYTPPSTHVHDMFDITTQQIFRGNAGCGSPRCPPKWKSRNVPRRVSSTFKYGTYTPRPRRGAIPRHVFVPFSARPLGDRLGSARLQVF